MAAPRPGGVVGHRRPEPSGRSAFPCPWPSARRREVSAASFWALKGADRLEGVVRHDPDDPHPGGGLGRLGPPWPFSSRAPLLLFGGAVPPSSSSTSSTSSSELILHRVEGFRGLVLAAEFQPIQQFPGHQTVLRLREPRDHGDVASSARPAGGHALHGHQKTRGLTRAARASEGGAAEPQRPSEAGATRGEAIAASPISRAMWSKEVFGVVGLGQEVGGRPGRPGSRWWSQQDGRAADHHPLIRLAALIRRRPRRRRTPGG